MNSHSPVWMPTKDLVKNSNMMRFAHSAGEEFSRVLNDTDEMHRWSVDYPEEFWSHIWDYCGVVGEKGARIIVDGDKLPGAKFFPDARLNIAENMLQFRGSSDAIVFRGEDKVKTRISWDDLRKLVSRMQQAMRAAGVSKGDRVAAMLPNVIESVAAMMATASLGAIWSSCSPDFGVAGVLDRFGQVKPKIFISCDGYWYNGKEIDVSEKLSEIVPALGAEKTVIISYLGKSEMLASNISGAETLETFLSDYQASNLVFERVSFDHPLYILFSSGTTGIPKCIVHSHGGILLQHVKEQRLHCGLNEDDRLFHFTTLGWMMWNWVITSLASGIVLMLYDGSPFAPSGDVLFEYADEEKFTMFGTSAKFIDAVRKARLAPGKSHDLSSLKILTSTGSPLAPENFDFVYSSIHPDVHLASMSGGTDIAACFVGGDPTKPVYKGEIQGPGLGMATEVWNDAGEPIWGEKGELVCTKPFPSVPVGFWNDEDGSKYHNAYFDRFDNVWCHGDFAEWTATGGMIIHGRSDATLNPGGVRIGTAEIYNQVEQMESVEEGLCIGQEWDNDVRVILFVRLAKGVNLSEDLVREIRLKIKTGASPRHVPAKIIAVDDIPRTKSGKITELAVRDIVHGREVKNQEALANPEALDLFVDLEELRTD